MGSLTDIFVPLNYLLNAQKQKVRTSPMRSNTKFFDRQTEKTIGSTSLELPSPYSKLRWPGLLGQETGVYKWEIALG
jgi:hypothetical protein